MQNTIQRNVVVSNIQAYVIPCPSCHGKLETHTAAWCYCVAKKLTPLCSNCGNCLCSLPAAALRSFWSSAPHWLAEASRKEQSRRAAAKPNTTAQAVDVLIVDDDEEIRGIAAYSLQQMGYSVAVATGAEEAMAAMDRVTPRLMLTDALMPKVDGRQLCQLVKMAYPSVKVVIMTAIYTAPRYKHEAYKTFRADDYLPKPIDFNQLRTVLARLAPLAPARVAVAA